MQNRQMRIECFIFVGFFSVMPGLDLNLPWPRVPYYLFAYDFRHPGCLHCIRASCDILYFGDRLGQSSSDRAVSEASAQKL